MEVEREERWGGSDEGRLVMKVGGGGSWENYRKIHKTGSGANNAKCAPSGPLRGQKVIMTIKSQDGSGSGLVDRLRRTDATFALCRLGKNGESAFELPCWCSEEGLPRSVTG